MAKQPQHKPAKREVRFYGASFILIDTNKTVRDDGVKKKISPTRKEK
jgi:hypothetical protein